MPPWLNNPWVVGIGGGVLSGFLVAWVTHLLLARGENKEYREKVASANRDVIYAIRPGISEGNIPTAEVVHALIESTARHHEVSRSDLYGPKQIAEELVKEVMDTSFLSSARKAEYCQQLLPLEGPPGAEQSTPTGARSESSELIASYRKETIEWVSGLLGFIAATMSVMTAFVFKYGSAQPREQDSQLQVLLIGLTATLVTATTFAFYWLRRRHDDLTETRRERTKPSEDQSKKSGGLPDTAG